MWLCVNASGKLKCRITRGTLIIPDLNSKVRGACVSTVCMELSVVLELRTLSPQAEPCCGG